MLRRGDRGLEVEKLQKALMALGYPLPRWGADGILGSETLGALALFLRDHAPGVTDDEADIVSDRELELLHSISTAKQSGASAPTLATGMFHDIRGSASQVHVYGRRPWTSVTGITLHQT